MLGFARRRLVTIPGLPSAPARFHERWRTPQVFYSSHITVFIVFAQRGRLQRQTANAGRDADLHLVRQCCQCVCKSILCRKNATLKELTALIQGVKKNARGRSAKLSFAFVYPDVNGKNVLRQASCLLQSVVMFSIGWHDLW